MDLQLRNRTAFLTAASGGLGYACAKALLEEGASVAIMARDRDSLNEAQSTLQLSIGGQVETFCGDLRKITDIDRFVNQATKQLGPPDIVVFSTGHPPVRAFSNASEEDWENGWLLVLKAAQAITRCVLPGMCQRKYGRLIYMGSVFGIEPNADSVVQSTMRAGLNAMAKCISLEAARDGVTANVLCPGFFDTPLVHALAEQRASILSAEPSSILEQWKRLSPTSKFGDPSELGALVAFLASPFASFIQGTALHIDGGMLHVY